MTPPIVAGASGAPREVNLIAKDYEFLPATLDLVPGETVLLHVINGGLDVHEAIIGDEAVQDAWEARRGRGRRGAARTDARRQRAAGRFGPAHRGRIGRARGRHVDGPDERVGRRTASLHRGLPHPRSLGARDAGPGALGRRLVSAPGGTLWTRAGGVRLSDVPTPLEEDAA